MATFLTILCSISWFQSNQSNHLCLQTCTSWQRDKNATYGHHGHGAKMKTGGWWHCQVVWVQQDQHQTCAQTGSGHEVASVKMGHNDKLFGRTGSRWDELIKS